MLKKYFFNSLLVGNSYRNGIYLSVNFKTPRKILFYVKSLATAAPELKDTSVTIGSRRKETLKSYFYQYLMKKPECYTSVFDINYFDSVNDGDPESLKLLKHIIDDTSKETTVQNELQKNFESELNSFKIKDICKGIYLLSQLEIAGHKTLFISLTAIFENQLKLRKFSKDEWLKLLFVMHETWNETGSYIYFLKKKSCIKLFNKIHSLSPEQAVQFFYCITPNLTNSRNKYKMLSYINDNMFKFKSDELGIIAFGLLESRITNNHLELEDSLMKKTLMEIENIHPHSFFVIIKVLKKFLLRKNVQQLLDFQEQIIPHLSRFDLISLINLALTGYNLRALNLSLWEYLRNTFQKKILDFQVLDISRILSIKVHYNICDEELLNLIVKNLEAKKISEKDYFFLLILLNHLIHFRLFPKNLLDMILTEKFVDSVNKNQNYYFKYHLLYLNYCVELEKPEYCYNILDNSLQAEFFQHSIHVLRRPKIQSPKLNEVLKKIFGDNMVHKTCCFPYFDIGYVLKFDKNLEAQPIPEDFKCAKKYCIKALNDGHFWILIKLCNLNDFLWNSETPSLQHQTQIRHLKLNGFVPVVVKKSVFFKQLTAQNEEAYLKDLINESLKHKSEKTKLKFL